MTISFTVPGVPVPWARARQNGKRFFTDPNVAAYKAEVALRAKAAGANPSESPCTLVITAILPVPPSWSAKRRREAQDGRVRHTAKPDWDNLGKGISDALNGIAWKDDSLVYWSNVKKVYGDNPRVEVTVSYDQPC